LIIPRSPTPDPVDVLSAHEIRQLARQRLAELEAPDIKSEAKRVKKVKRERNEGGEIETIDLTDDNASGRLLAKRVKIRKEVTCIDLTNDGVEG